MAIIRYIYIYTYNVHIDVFTFTFWQTLPTGGGEPKKSAEWQRVFWGQLLYLREAPSVARTLTLVIINTDLKSDVPWRLLWLYPHLMCCLSLDFVLTFVWSRSWFWMFGWDAPFHFGASVVCVFFFVFCIFVFFFWAGDNWCRQGSAGSSLLICGFVCVRDNYASSYRLSLCLMVSMCCNSLVK